MIVNFMPLGEFMEEKRVNRTVCWGIPTCVESGGGGEGAASGVRRNRKSGVAQKPREERAL